MSSLPEQPPIADVTLDAGQTACGDLVLLIVQRVKQLSAGQVLHVVGYDRGAGEDIPAWCRMTQNRLLHVAISKAPEQPSHFYIQKGS